MSAALALILATATPYADLPSIDREVARFTGAAIGQEGGASLPVDRRLRLNPCYSPLALAWRTPRRETVVVECPDNGGWRLFVPTRAAAVEAAAAPAISRGDAVTIAISGPGFNVSQPGEALEPGAIGAWVRVRAVGGKVRSANDTIRAQVVRPGLVTLPMP